MNQNQNQGLTPEKLQMFIATLSGLPEDEVRKAKILFLKNQISDLKMMKTTYSSFGSASGCFGIIPIFWPIMRMQKNMMNSALTRQVEQIRNALDVWQYDLGSEARELENDLNRLLSE